MTWGETASDNLKFNERRSYKADVSPSRPMICSAACLETTLYLAFDYSPSAQATYDNI
jgi:hypothetical protein